MITAKIIADSISPADLRHISPGSGEAWSSSTYREPSAGDSVYDLQGLVSHSGTLHGVSVRQNCVLFVIF